MTASPEGMMVPGVNKAASYVTGLNTSLAVSEFFQDSMFLKAFKNKNIWPSSWKIKETGTTV